MKVCIAGSGSSGATWSARARPPPRGGRRVPGESGGEAGRVRGAKRGVIDEHLASLDRGSDEAHQSRSGELTVIGSSNMAAIPSASIAHIAYTSCPLGKRTT